MRPNRLSFLAAVVGLLLATFAGQFARCADQFSYTGDDLAQEDGPFLVYGYNNDFAEKGTQQGNSFDSLAEAQAEAVRYVRTNANRGGRAEIYAYTQTPTKTQTITLGKPPKKQIKEEKKAEPDPDSKSSPSKGVEPYNPPGESKPKLGGKTYGGSESASNTTSLTFVFNEDYSVLAYDDIGLWNGTWEMVGDADVAIHLTDPRKVNYLGHIDGDKISGRAGKLGGNGHWNWKVTKK